ncbi:GNAT family N-acetyltransferase [Nocardia takedensis]|uniref:GNAT family N-acetyltransferase n=1 Tax=Nocardia takedensis TaxID=259390 RepID=UPI003F75C743
MAVEDSGTGEWIGMAGAFLDRERDDDRFVLPDPPVSRGDRWAMVYAMYVRPEARAHGVADSLCVELARWAGRDAGVRWLGLHVRDTNTRAIALYARHGYETVARREHVELGVSSLVMVRPVTLH